MSLSLHLKVRGIIAGLSMIGMLGMPVPNATASPGTVPVTSHAQLTTGSFVMPQAVRKDGAVPCKFVSSKTSTISGANVPARAGGSKTQQYAFVTLMNCLLDAIPRGGSASISTYELNDNGATNSLISAISNRRVKLVFATSGQHGTAQTNRLKKAIAGASATGSRFILCNHSCYWSGSGGIHHAKVAVFKQVIGAEGKAINNLIVTASGNLDSANMRQWNAWEILTGKPKLYAAAKNYIDGMAVDRTSFFKAVTEGGATLGFGPTKGSDLSLGAIKGFGCSAGTSVIRVQMYIIAGKRGKQAVSWLRQKQREGCRVGVIYSSLRSSKSTVKRLSGYCPTYSGQRRCIELYDAYKHSSKSTSAIYTHAKTVALRGYKVVKGKKVAVNIYVGGSRNWSDNSHNTEISVRVSSKVFVSQAFDRFNVVSKFSVKK
ncbi:MAG: hypothetical protein ABIP74_00620 [Candidatus Saccharimonas sp.]